MIPTDTISALRAALVGEKLLRDHVALVSMTGESKAVRIMAQNVEWQALEMAAMIGATIALERTNQDEHELALRAEEMEIK